MDRRTALALVVYAALAGSLLTPLYDPLAAGRDDSWTLLVLLAAAHLGAGVAVRRAWVLLAPIGLGLRVVRVRRRGWPGVADPALRGAAAGRCHAARCLAATDFAATRRTSRRSRSSLLRCPEQRRAGAELDGPPQDTACHRSERARLQRLVEQAG